MIIRYILGGVAFTAIVGGAYLYYNNTQLLIKQFEASLIASEQRANRLSAENEALIEDNKELAQNTNNLIESLQVAEARTKNLLSILAEHDLNYLAAQKPKLIENRINNATNKLIKELEEMTR